MKDTLTAIGLLRPPPLLGEVILETLARLNQVPFTRTVETDE